MCFITCYGIFTVNICLVLTVCYHAQDFGNSNAFRLLETWQNKATCFNDDIQASECATMVTYQAKLGIEEPDRY